jgi:2-polyprenyl-3-methyl-5-hydroxy-6-metoxy-1,4-benzoquinol methylase
MRPSTLKSTTPVVTGTDSFCPGCAGRSVRAVGALARTNRFVGTKVGRWIGGGTLCACDECALWFRYPQPSKSELDELYRSVKAVWNYDGQRREDWELSRSYITRHFAAGSVLDVGCWDGSFLGQLPTHYGKHGVEINPDAGEMARRKSIKLVSRDLERLSAVPSYDIITAFDVLEHVHNPAALLKRLARSLNAHGAILISSGDTSAPSWRWMGSQYWYCTLAEHIAFIGEQWLRTNCVRYGLVVDEVRHFRHENFSAARWLRQSTLNVMNRVAPGTMTSLRNRLKGTQVDSAETYVPVWTQAKDHVWAALRKRA